MSNMTTKTTAKRGVKKAQRVRKRQTVGKSIIQGLKEAIAWTNGQNDNVRVTLVARRNSPPNLGSRRPR
jgi:hypothetical protein